MRLGTPLPSLYQACESWIALVGRLAAGLVMSGGGLDPTLGAVLPLLGVVLGGMLGGAVAYTLKRRDERREFRAVARVLAAQLDECVALMAFIVENNRWEHVEDANMRPGLWEAHQLIVGRFLSRDDEWEKVAYAFSRGRAAGLLIGGVAERADRARIASRLGTAFGEAADILRLRTRRHGRSRGPRYPPRTRLAESSVNGNVAELAEPAE